MARIASVELIGCLSYVEKGRTFKKGSPQLITNPAEILFYQCRPEFTVTFLAETKSEVATKSVVVPEIKPETKSETKSENSTKSTEKIETKSEIKTQPKKVLYSKDKLGTLRKKNLVDIAAEMEVMLDGSESKSEMIDAIIAAQEK